MATVHVCDHCGETLPTDHLSIFNYWIDEDEDERIDECGDFCNWSCVAECSRVRALEESLGPKE